VRESQEKEFGSGTTLERGGAATNSASADYPQKPGGQHRGGGLEDLRPASRVEGKRRGNQVHAPAEPRERGSSFGGKEKADTKHGARADLKPTKQETLPFLSNPLGVREKRRRGVQLCQKSCCEDDIGATQQTEYWQNI